MKPLLLIFALSASVLISDAVLAWSFSSQSFNQLQHCVFSVNATCPEGATCNEQGEVICAPGEECEEEEPDCD